MELRLGFEFRSSEIRRIEVVKKRKIYLKQMQAHDLAKEDSTVRLIEMTVDGMLRDQGYALQFWKDVALYGIDEAVMYLKGSDCCRKDANFAELDKEVAEVRAAIEGKFSLNKAAEELETK